MIPPDWNSWLPFVLGAGAVPAPHINVARIVEALIIAVVTAGVVTYAQQLVMGEQIKALKFQVQELQQEVRDMRRDFYAPRVQHSKAAVHADI